jgi:hypothetical protein
MVPDDIRVYLETLFPPDASGHCELRALPSRARAFVPLPLDADALTTVRAFVHAHLHEHIFTGVATRRTPTDGTAENCAELWCVFVDLDAAQLADGTVRERLERFPLPPTLQVHSGGGLHVYWQLREPFSLPADALAATRLLRRLASHFDGDPACAEIARILRIPGTLNHKHSPPRVVAIEREVHVSAVV